tara:strand:+ start:5883 stop:6476 length:594 start_codon:yes stop_codon:yes gene_type:complete
MAIPTSELQSINPSSRIELFTLALSNTLHGSSEVLRFHSGTNMNTNAPIIWQGNTYQRQPIQATGFAFTGRGQIPRPTLTIANLIGFSAGGNVVTVSDLMLTVNLTTPNNDLIGAVLTRIVTLASSLDATNFPNNTNPFGTPNSDEFPQEIYVIDRKTNENRQFVEFELTGEIDQSGKKIPVRQVTRKDFAGVGTFT